MTISSLWSRKILAVAAVVFLGCADDAAVDGPKVVKEQTGDYPDPCTLAGDGELEAVSGRKPVRHVSEPYAGKAQCTWYDGEGMVLFVVSIEEGDLFEPPLRDLLQYAPVTGVGDDAFLSSGASVYVRTPKLAFSAQSLFPVADGMVSGAIRTAEAMLATAYQDDVLMYEGGYRLGKMVVGRL